MINSHILIVNAPIKIDVPIGEFNFANESKTHMKRGRLVGFEDENPRKKKN